LERSQCSPNITTYGVSARLQQQDFNDAARPTAGFRCFKKPFQETHCFDSGAARQKKPGHGDVLELAHVLEIVVNG
jgi:hypothetical protein